VKKSAQIVFLSVIVFLRSCPRRDYSAALHRVFHHCSSTVIPHRFADSVGALLGSCGNRWSGRDTGRRFGFGFSVARQSATFRGSTGAIHSDSPRCHGRRRSHRGHSRLPTFPSGIRRDSSFFRQRYSRTSARSLHGRLADSRSTIGHAALAANPRVCNSRVLYRDTHDFCHMEPVARLLTTFVRL
jgi:hypothetical protein